MSLENYNIANDARSCEPAKVEILYMDDGREIELPMKTESCEVCHGTGSHVNPAIDAGGISADEFNDDPDFLEGYKGGRYDVRCNRCQGRTTIPVVDWQRLTGDEREAYQAQLDSDADYEAERLAEIRAGC